MRITLDNYKKQTCSIDFNALPEALKKGNELTQKVIDSSSSAYRDNETIKRVIDSYILKLNTHLSSTQKQSVKPKPSNKTSPATSKKAVPTRKPRKIVKSPVKPAPKEVESLSIEQKFIKRYVSMHGKVKTKLSILRLLVSLQKAILEKRIRKTSTLSAEIRQMQGQLIDAAERMGEQAQININEKSLENYRRIAGANSVRTSIALLKRFVSIHGRELDVAKIDRLISSIENAIKKGKVNSADPYFSKVSSALKALKDSKKSKTVEISTSELNGIQKVVGIVDATANKPNGVISSSELLAMDFETIGLQGKFRELIGDPSVGFTAMVFGQPKSGKSTLMLEFAQHLAKNHGKVLYVAIEEGYGYTLKEKIQRVGAVHPDLHFAESTPTNCKEFEFVFIDSVSRAGMELEDLVKLKKQNPKTAFVYVFHSTKEGKFRGGNEFAHEVDCIIEVRQDGIDGKGRFGGGYLNNTGMYSQG